MSDVCTTIRCVNADETIAFLTKAFGLEEGAVHRDDQGKIVHAELWFGSCCVMPGPEGGATGPASLYAVVEDADAHHDRAVGAGAEIVTGLRDTDYGSRDYAAKDIDGNLWYFGTYRPAKPGN
jgi:uncharacterized glyoxalase superfamily protein PhnB